MEAGNREINEILKELELEQLAEISLCRHCWCMTHTLKNGRCAKCFAPKMRRISDGFEC